MNKKEAEALNILSSTPRVNWTTKDKVKKLGEEVQELTWDVSRGNKKKTLDEMGDCLLLLLSILDDVDKTKTISITDLALKSAKKIRKRKI